MHIEDWHNEYWIKNVSREAFISWCATNKPEYSAEESGLIYDSHVLPKLSELPVTAIPAEVATEQAVTKPIAPYTTEPTHEGEED